jgi:hypothetical protein
MVYRIVCRVFYGPCPEGHTCDHRDGNTSNNRSYNLRWATWKKQRENQRVHRLRQNAREVRIRGNDWPEDRPWEVFGSVNRAAKEYGLNADALRGIADGTIENSKTPYMVEYTEAAESQSPLEAGDDSNLDIPPLDPPPAASPTVGPSTTEEEWKFAPGVENLKISDRGRVQTKTPRGDGWSRMREIAYGSAVGSKTRLCFKRVVGKYYSKDRYDPVNLEKVWLLDPTSKSRTQKFIDAFSCRYRRAT